METILVILTALSLLLHLPAVQRFIAKTKTKADDLLVVGVDKAKDALEN